MIIVHSPLLYDEIKEQLETHQEPSYTLLKQEGIKLYFQTNHEDQEEAAGIAKKIIKEQVNDVLLFNVRIEEYF